MALDDHDHGARGGRAGGHRRPHRGALPESGALRDGHFLLKSGRHSDAYLEKFAVLSDPAATSELCAFWAGQHRGADDRPSVDLVAGPTTGGVILAFETGRQLGTRAIFAEEVKGDGPPRREFRRGFRIEPGERVLLVDDILTTGGSLLAMIPAVEAAGGEIVECAVLVDRSGGLSALASPTTGRRYCAQRALDPRPADVRARARDAARGARPASPSTHRGAPARLREATATSRSSPQCCWSPHASRSRTSPPPPTPDRGLARRDGVVIAVDASGLADVRGFTLRTSGGFAFTFVLGTLENAADFSPSHLAEHQVSSEPIRAWFRVASGERVVYRLEDAPG